MTHSATFSLSYPDDERAVRIERSLRPEVGDIEGDRTRAELSRDGATVTIAIEADDFVALRAGLNTWLSLANVAERAGGIDPSRDESDLPADGDTGRPADE